MLSCFSRYLTLNAGGRNVKLNVHRNHVWFLGTQDWVQSMNSSSQVLWPSKASKTATTRTIDIIVMESQPVHSNLCTLQLALSTVVGNKVTKIVSNHLLRTMWMWVEELKKHVEKLNSGFCVCVGVGVDCRCGSYGNDTCVYVIVLQRQKGRKWKQPWMLWDQGRLLLLSVMCQKRMKSRYFCCIPCEVNEKWKNITCCT